MADAGCITEVWCESTRGYGSGYLIQPHLVLTACHVVDDSGQDLPEDLIIKVRPYAVWQAGGKWLSATLVWPKKADWRSRFEQDIALLEIDPTEITRKTAQTLKIGWDDPLGADKVDVVATGFPKLKEKAEKRDTYTVFGKIPPFADLKAQQWNVEYVGRQPERDEDWSGISGAALFAKDRLVGVISRKVRNESDFRPGIKDFTAVRIEPALDQEAFQVLLY